MRRVYILGILIFFSLEAFSQGTYALVDNEKNVFGYAEITPMIGKGAYYHNYTGIPTFKATEFNMIIQDIKLNKINDVRLKFDVPVTYKTEKRIEKINY